MTEPAARRRPSLNARNPSGKGGVDHARIEAAVREILLAVGRTYPLTGLGLDSTTFTRLLDSLEVMSLGRGGLGGAAGNDAELKRLIDQMMGEQSGGARPSSRSKTLH